MIPPPGGSGTCKEKMQSGEHRTPGAAEAGLASMIPTGLDFAYCRAERKTAGTL